MVLVFHMDVEGDGRVFPACAMAAGNQVASESALTPMARRVVRGPRQWRPGIGLAQRNFAGVAVQGLPGFGGSAGRGAAHQYLAHALFQQLDALRHRRAGDVQHGGCALEAAFVDDGRKRIELGRIELHGWLAILTDR